jgi:hypothetical protein
MADIINELSELNILFQALLLDMLGWQKEGSPEKYTKQAFAAVRVSWPTEGAPAWDVTEDVLFIQVLEDDDPINRQRNTEFTDVGSPVELNQETTYTRVIKLGMIAYGPNSWKNIQTIRDKMFSQSGRETLALKQLCLIPDVTAPVRFPEQFQARWYERIDFELRFNEQVTRNVTIPYVENVEVIVSDTIRSADVIIE